MLRLRFERISQHKTQGNLGREVGVPQQVVSLIERGRVNPTAGELERLAFVLNVSPPHILMKQVVVAVEETAHV